LADEIIPESPNGPVARAVAASGDIPKVRVAGDGAPKVVAKADGAPQVRVAGSPPRVIPKVAAATPHVVEATPKVAQVTPAVVVQPTVAAQPAIAAQPAVAAKPVVAVQPSIAAQPVVAAKPAIAAQPVVVPTAAAVPQVKAVAAAPAASTPSAAVPVAAAKPAAATPAAKAKAKTPTPARIAAARVAPDGKVGGGPVDHRVKEEGESHPLKWLCIGLGALIFLLIGANFVLVNHPLNSNLAQTKFSEVSVYSHLGAFMQPSVLVIHIRPSDAVTPETLVPFLVALAHSTPNSPFTGEPYARVALTSGWTAQYSFSGYSWKELGDMSSDTDEQIKMDILTRMSGPAGDPLIEPTTSDEVREARRAALWSELVGHFTKSK
jgi:hypothetical protein